MPEADDGSIIVAVFDGYPGGYLPIGEFGALCAELEAARARMQRLSCMLAAERVLWFAAGLLVGVPLGLVLAAA